jgi:hypothetical protein
MRIKTCTQKNKMGKNVTANFATSWVPSKFKQKDLEKAQANSLISTDDQVNFPSTDRIPKPPSGFWVMFFDFLLRGLSLPAHEFLRGLLFIYGVQLHQLTPKSILHIACFITLCESLLGIEPHFLLWKCLFRLRPSVSLAKKPELGGAVIYVRTESQYLEFSMAASVRGCKKKWFYIKDQKASPSDLFGIAPFDAAKNLEKLASWDSPPTEAEMEDVKPLLARIQVLKSVDGGALTGTQLMAFFLQRRVQPLQHRPSKLWSFSGLGDSLQVSDDLFEKKDLDKRVRALTILTKEDKIPDLTASYYDAQHPLPTVSFTVFYSPYFSLIIICLVTLGLFSFQDHRLLVSRPLLLEGGAIPNVPIYAAFEAPEAEDNQDGDEGEDSLERTSSTTSPPPALSEDIGIDKKRKCVKEFTSSSASTHKTVVGETPTPEDDVELFDLMDS